MRRSLFSIGLAIGLAACTGEIGDPDKFETDPDETPPEPEPFPDDDPAPTPLQAADDIAVTLQGGLALGPDDVDVQTLEDPDAAYLRLHIASLDLQPGDELAILDPAGLVVDSFTGSGTDIWTRSVDADRLTVELRSGDATGPRGYEVDLYARGLPTPVPEDPADGSTWSVCGRSDFQDAACYANDPDVSAAAAAVGAMRFGGACTGALVSSQGHFITNNHCISSQSQANRLEVRFDYQRTSCGGGTTAQYRSVVGATLLRTSRTLDYSLLLLDENPAPDFGYLELDSGSPSRGTQIYIPQHPGGRLKQISSYDSQLRGPCAITRARSSRGINVGYTCDTEPGSSGSPVISAGTHRMVGLHHLGGCSNQATDMNLIYPEIIDLLPDDGGGSDDPPPPDDPPDDPPPPPSDGTPRSGSASATIGPSGSRAYYIANVVPGSDFTVRTQPRSGAPSGADIDLFVSFDDTPTRSDFDLVDGNATATETVSGTVPSSADTIYILVDGYAGTVPFTVSAEWMAR